MSREHWHAWSHRVTACRASMGRSILFLLPPPWNDCATLQGRHRMWFLIMFPAQRYTNRDILTGSQLCNNLNSILVIIHMGRGTMTSVFFIPTRHFPSLPPHFASSTLPTHPADQPLFSDLDSRLEPWLVRLEARTWTLTQTRTQA